MAYILVSSHSGTNRLKKVFSTVKVSVNSITPIIMMKAPLTPLDQAHVPVEGSQPAGRSRQHPGCHQKRYRQAH